jgi:hypothetical protein
MNDIPGGILFTIVMLASVAAFVFWPERRRVPLPHEPTAKQLRYARFIGVTIPPGCTRRELSRLIDRALRG